MNSTIVAISTASSGGALSVVRISGKDSLKIAKELTKKQSFTPRYATLCDIFDSQSQILDEAIVIFFKAPHSYTAEDVCEIQCHGGLIVAQSILKECLALGATLAKSGEFTKRAFLNGRIDLSQAQAISQLIDAKSTQSQKVLISQLKGSLGDFVEEIREKLFETLAFSEVMIDYSEEDIAEDTLENMSLKIYETLSRLENIHRHSLNRSGVFEGFKISIVGKPNVGKSSLLNALLLYERAIVSDIPGTTRDTIEECLNVGGNIVRFVDTAGIRDSDDEVEKIGIARAKECISKSDIILGVFDSSVDFDKYDEEILELLNKNRDKNIIIIINKCDLTNVVSESRFSEFNKVLRISTKESNSVVFLLDLIEEILSSGDSGEIILSAQYQIQAVSSAIQSLKIAIEILKTCELELFSYNVREAIEHIGSITKPYEDADLLDKIFSQFCLGK